MYLAGFTTGLLKFFLKKEKVTSVLQNLGFEQSNPFELLEVPELRSRNSPDRYLKPTPHGIRSQIPLAHSHKKVISIKRNPFERIVFLVRISRLGSYRKTIFKMK